MRGGGVGTDLVEVGGDFLVLFLEEDVFLHGKVVVTGDGCL